LTPLPTSPISPIEIPDVKTMVPENLKYAFHYFQAAFAKDKNGQFNDKINPAD